MKENLKSVTTHLSLTLSFFLALVHGHWTYHKDLIIRRNWCAIMGKRNWNSHQMTLLHSQFQSINANSFFSISFSVHCFDRLNQSWIRFGLWILLNWKYCLRASSRSSIIYVLRISLKIIQQSGLRGKPNLWIFFFFRWCYYDFCCDCQNNNTQTQHSQI